MYRPVISYPSGATLLWAAGSGHRKQCWVAGVRPVVFPESGTLGTVSGLCWIACCHWIIIIVVLGYLFRCSCVAQVLCPSCPGECIESWGCIQV